MQERTEAPRLLSADFSDINRYWDRANMTHAAKILPGEYFVSAKGELITTVLGSCIAACVRDRTSGIGGMNHFMLPRVATYQGTTAKKMLSVAGRYGNVAMERLINCILANGGQRNQLEFKIFGGARVLDIDSEVGNRNILFITEYLQLENFRVDAQDLGGVFPRKVNYYPGTGKVLVKKLRRIQGTVIQDREQNYYQSIDDKPVESDITFFSD